MDEDKLIIEKINKCENDLYNLESDIAWRKFVLFIFGGLTLLNILSLKKKKGIANGFGLLSSLGVSLYEIKKLYEDGKMKRKLQKEIKINKKVLTKENVYES